MPEQAIRGLAEFERIQLQFDISRIAKILGKIYSIDESIAREEVLRRAFQLLYKNYGVDLLKAVIQDREVFARGIRCNKKVLELTLLAKIKLLVMALAKDIFLFFYGLYSKKIDSTHIHIGDTRVRSYHDIENNQIILDILNISNEKNIIILGSGKRIFNYKDHHFYTQRHYLCALAVLKYRSTAIDLKKLATYVKLLFLLTSSKGIFAILLEDFTYLSTFFSLNKELHVTCENASMAGTYFGLSRKFHADKLVLTLFPYSSNCYLFSQRDGGGGFINPYLRHMQFDAIRSLDQDFLAWIAASNLCAEAILLPPKFPIPLKAIPKPRKVKRIVIYDVAPITSEDWEDKLFPGIPNYYSAQCMNKFIQDIVNAVADDPEVNIFLKPKRALIRNWQDPSYTKFRDELVARGKISILFIDHLIGSDDPQSTIYISIPFSTPSVIGQGNDIVSAYYDPTGRLFDPRRYKQVPMLSNFQELSSFVNA